MINLYSPDGTTLGPDWWDGSMPHSLDVDIHQEKDLNNHDILLNSTTINSTGVIWEQYLIHRGSHIEYCVQYNPNDKEQRDDVDGI